MIFLNFNEINQERRNGGLLMLSEITFTHSVGQCGLQLQNMVPKKSNKTLRVSKRFERKTKQKTKYIPLNTK